MVPGGLPESLRVELSGDGAWGQSHTDGMTFMLLLFCLQDLVHCSGNSLVPACTCINCKLLCGCIINNTTY